jgi:hypothetical protein
MQQSFVNAVLRNLVTIRGTGLALARQPCPQSMPIIIPAAAASASNLLDQIIPPVASKFSWESFNLFEFANGFVVPPERPHRSTNLAVINARLMHAFSLVGINLHRESVRF